jgi:hypothetical protein
MVLIIRHTEAQMAFKAELPMYHWSKVVGFGRRVGARLGFIETWENVALIHLITDRTRVGDPYVHHYVTLRRSSKGRREIIVASPMRALCEEHSFYQAIIKPWAKGRLEDDYLRYSEQKFTKCDSRDRMLWPQAVSDGRAVRV